MSRFGPGRGELALRLALSLIGLGGIGLGAALHGFHSLVWIEIALFGGLFFGLMGIWSAYALWCGRAS